MIYIMLKDIQKAIKGHHMLALGGLLVLIYIVMQYSKNKGMSMDGMGNKQGSYLPSPSNNVMPAKTHGNEVFESVNGSSRMGTVTSMPTIDPKELLPKDNNSEWAALNPRGNGGLDTTMLTAGWTHGINTVGSSLRNPNLQLRPEYPNPLPNGESPWNTSTITPDLTRNPAGFCG